MVRVMDNPIKAKQDEITTSVRELLMDGAAHQEVMGVLREHFAKKELWIIRNMKQEWCVMRQTRTGINKGMVFTSASLAPCVDFALKWEVPNA